MTNYRFFLNLLFLSTLIFFAIGPNLTYSATEAPPPTDPPAAAPTCPDRENNVCLGALTKAICEKPQLGDEGAYQNGICVIDRDKFKLANFLSAVIEGFLLKAALAISLILIIYAGILYMVSGNDPGKANTAKDIIFTTLLGIAFLFFTEIILAQWIGSAPISVIDTATPTP